MDSAAPQDAFDASIVNDHTDIQVTKKKKKRKINLCQIIWSMHWDVFYLFTVIFITAEFEIILKHPEKNNPEETELHSMN